MFRKKTFVASSIVGLILLPSLVLAQYGLEETAGAAGLAKYGTSIPGMIGNILGTALSLVGVIFFALMLFGGIMWMTSRGNQEQEKKALDTITAAIIGIIIVLGSYALTSFVFNNLVKGGGESPTPTPTPTSVQKCTAKAVDGFVIVCLTGQIAEDNCTDLKVKDVFKCKWSLVQDPPCQPEKSQNEYCGSLSVDKCNKDYCEVK